MFVWGVDPGLSRCGYAVLEVDGRRARPVALGVLTTPPGDDVPHRLAVIAADVAELVRDYPPSDVAVERVLFSVNTSTAIGVAQAAGVVMAQGFAAGAAVAEYSPNEIKQSVTGDGAADKTMVEMMVRRLLGIEHRIRPVDAADAAAVALCHLARAPMRARVGAAGGGGSR